MVSVARTSFCIPAATIGEETTRWSQCTSCPFFASLLSLHVPYVRPFSFPSRGTGSCSLLAVPVGFLVRPDKNCMHAGSISFNLCFLVIVFFFPHPREPCRFRARRGKLNIDKMLVCFPPTDALPYLCSPCLSLLLDNYVVLPPSGPTISTA